MLHTMPAAQTIATTPVRNLCMTAPLLPRCVQVVLLHQTEIIGRPQFIGQSIAVLQRRRKDSLMGRNSRAKHRLDSLAGTILQAALSVRCMQTGTTIKGAV